MKNLYEKPSFKAKVPVLILLFLMLLIAIIFRLVKLLEIKSYQFVDANKKVEVLSKENTVLAVQAKESKVIKLTEEQIKKLLAILMPKQKDQDHFMKILACENGSHDPKRVNVNKPGLGYDLGVAQINSRFHSNRVKEFFGQDFDEAMQDPVKNLVYAAYLYQHSGFGAWVCNEKIAMRGGE